MSELQRRWAKAKMDARAAGTFDERDEEEDDDETGAPITATRFPAPHRRRSSADGPLSLGDLDDDASSSSASSASSTGTVVPSASHHLFARPGRTLDPIPWTAFFERELFLQPPGDAIVHHAYLTSPVGKGPLFVMHHGAGSSGLSFAVVGAEIRKRLPAAGVLSVEARDHGLTADATDLGLSTLAADLVAVLRQAQAEMRWPALPPLVLVGHSLGGAVATEVAASGLLGADGADALLGLAVLDVVEGSALDALQSMKAYLATRPAGFASVAAGIDWHLRSRTIRNATSARVSVPPLLVPGPSSSSSGLAWRWRTDLAATQPFWQDWFAGLSKKFLSARGGKLLLLAGTDRLDTELTIGQMQGKYTLQVFPEAGHFIHEDLPEKTALMLVDFYRRNDRTALVLPPKVSELLAQGKKV